MAETPQPSSDPQPPAPGFEFNQPTIITLLYFAAYFTGITAIVGVVLAYSWREETAGTWAASHMSYLANTFWIGLAGTVIGIATAIFLIGFLILLATGIQVLVRCILSLIAAQKKEAMPNPDSWTI
ncbi:DUF4870 family protein [Pontixanthobacter aquaemixtae]|uniref:DUF4870 domain-containing protein n=1 Tax=Pontixanthobacter aquaemixtae TaxID=1958940 RepID=A0A844ZWX6_9SPHN|nr:hypothetical protein [Pontixanthobacter aquaemixtae]MXO91680.1 hypothetical protein [Pontixanthobacter aquaemixtae]